MKKNILIIILTLTTVFSIVYAFIKADEATKAAAEARNHRMRAEQFQNEAIEAAAKAMEQQWLAEKALAECESSK